MENNNVNNSKGSTAAGLALIGLATIGLSSICKGIGRGVSRFIEGRRMVKCAEKLENCMKIINAINNDSQKSE